MTCFEDAPYPQPPAMTIQKCSQCVALAGGCRVAVVVTVRRLAFQVLYNCWCHNPVATFALCLLAQAYDLGAAVVSKLYVVQGYRMGA